MQWIPALIVLLFVACSSTTITQEIQHARFTTCQSKTIKEMLDGSLNNVAWEEKKSKHDVPFVNVTGKYIYAGTLVETFIQFVLVEKRQVKLTSLKFDDVVQNDTVKKVFVMILCAPNAQG